MFLLLTLFVFVLQILVLRSNEDEIYVLDVFASIRDYKTNLYLYDAIVGHYNSSFFAIGGVDSTSTTSSSIEMASSNTYSSIRVASFDTDSTTTSTQEPLANMTRWETIDNFDYDLRCDRCYIQIDNLLYILAPGLSSPTASKMIVFDMATRTRMGPDSSNNNNNNNNNFEFDMFSGLNTSRLNDTSYTNDYLMFMPCVVHDGNRIYAMGGYKYISDSYSVINNMFIYDIDTNSWSIGANMPTARAYTQCIIDTTYSNYIFVFGGIDSPYFSDNTLSQMEMYDIEKNQWFDVTIGDINSNYLPRIGTAATIIHSMTDNENEYEIITFIGGTKVDWTIDDGQNSDNLLLLINYFDQDWTDTNRNVSLIDISERYTIVYDKWTATATVPATTTMATNGSIVKDGNITTTPAPSKAPTGSPTEDVTQDIDDFNHLMHFGYYLEDEDTFYLLFGFTHEYRDYSQTIWRVSMSVVMAGMFLCLCFFMLLFPPFFFFNICFKSPFAMVLD